MNARRDEINSLCQKRSTLKHQGRFGEAIPIQQEILDDAISNGHIRDVSNAWNYLAMLYYKSGQYSDAENAARQSLAKYEEEPEPGDEVIGTYKMLLAEILAAQRRFGEAVAVAESAAQHYSVFHNPPDEFLLRMKAELDLMIQYRDRNSLHQG
jgi:tetratricopeptide (TPR) repeat protein